MHKKIFNAIYVLNVTFQAFFTLAMPIGVMLLLSWLAVDKAGWPSWVYAPAVVFGALFGFYSMIRFVLSAMRSIEAIEKESNEKTNGKAGNNNEKK